MIWHVLNVSQSSGSIHHLKKKNGNQRLLMKNSAKRTTVTKLNLKKTLDVLSVTSQKIARVSNTTC